MIDQEKVLALIKTQGPVLPAQVAKVINQDTLIASAYLSELTNNKKIKISNTKIGGSPVYYLQGQEQKLQDLYKHLNEREKEAFDLLKQKKVLKDNEQTPQVRVALRNIKDFAVPLNVTHEGSKELFWKWYLISNDEATKTIQALLQNPEQTLKKQPEPEIRKEIKREITKPPEPKPEPKEDTERKLFEEEKKKIEEEKKKIEEERKKIGEEQEKLKQRLQEEERLLKEKEKQLEEERKKLQEEQKKKTQEEQKKLTKKEKELEDPFYAQIKTYLDSKKIELKDYKVIKKKKEIDLLVKVPSVIGKLDYLCKAKKKRKISDSDINAIFVEGQIKKLPVLFLTTGTLSKKAQEKLINEFKGVIVDRIG